MPAPRDGHGTAWTLAIVASAAAAIVGAEIDGLRGLHYTFKPLTTLLILGMALGLSPEMTGYRHLVVVGLLLSTLGDVFLMLPLDAFVFGLGSFLLAHVAYLFALRKRGSWWGVRWPMAVYAIVAGWVFARLWPGLPEELRVPVIVYVLALAGMAAQAASVWRQQPRAATRIAAMGGAFFVMSDALLALDRFSAPIPHAGVWVLVTYWVAQWCIAFSTARLSGR